MKKINIAKDFTPTPGGRFKSDGTHSGELFRERCLEPLFENGEPTEKIRIVFDGSYGYPSSFLEEAFGGLARKVGISQVLKWLEFSCEDEPLLTEEVEKYIKESTGGE